jgi:lipoprotein-anchoring transpeptidase ErfK/SrfK
MSEAFKWIGGSTVVAVVLLGSAVIAGQAIEAQETAGHSERAAPVAAVVEAPVVATPVVEAAPAPAPEQPFVIKSILPIEGAIKYGEWHWDESRAPADGPLVMTVDLEARVISVFRGGHEIGAAAVLLGTDEHPTPTGVFPILTKERHNVSEKYGNAPMPWSLRLTWDGVAIHGGSTVENGYASHGCIGAPDAFVSKLFAIAGKGDKVIITRGRKAGLGTSLAAL